MSGVVLQSAALAAGVLLGLFFFGGLWWTILRGLTSANPALWFGLSALLRLAVVSTGFFYIARSGLASMLLGLLGLVIARIVVTLRTRFIAG
jgi:F1F0 ATPase subunit 2